MRRRYLFSTDHKTIGVQYGVTTVVLGLFVRFFVSLGRRSREAAHLVEDRFESTVR